MWSIWNYFCACRKSNAKKTQANRIFIQCFAFAFAMQTIAIFAKFYKSKFYLNRQVLLCSNKLEARFWRLVCKAEKRIATSSKFPHSVYSIADESDNTIYIVKWCYSHFYPIKWKRLQHFILIRFFFHIWLWFIAHFDADIFLPPKNKHKRMKKRN